MNNRSLIIFVKNPELGKVKTRLAKTVGEKAALKIYTQLLKYTLSVASTVEATKTIYFSSKIEEGQLWKGFNQELQAKGDLGEKMSIAIQQQLEKHDQCLIIGSDCAELSTQIIEEAFNQLSHHDVVIGPANDGGYYLLAMKASNPAIFDGIDWSTDKVLSQTIDKLKSENKNYFLLPELIDVDDENDWNLVKENFDYSD